MYFNKIVKLSNFVTEWNGAHGNIKKNMDTVYKYYIIIAIEQFNNP